MSDNNKDYGIYILVLTTLVIFLDSIKKYTFLLAATNLSYATILLPFSFIITNTITKKYNYKKTIIAIISSMISLIIFKSLIAFSLGEKLLFFEIGKDIASLIISQFINLVIYNYLINNTKNSYFSIFFSYLLSIVIFNMIYTILSLDSIILDLYLKKYIITLGIQVIICIPITYIDRKIKKNSD